MHHLKFRCVVCCLDGVRPVCLPRLKDSFPPGSSCWVTGWGYTREGGEHTSLHTSHTVQFISPALFFNRFSVITPEAGSRSGHRSVVVLTVIRLWISSHSQNALCRCDGGRSGLMSGKHSFQLVFTLLYEFVVLMMCDCASG